MDAHTAEKEQAGRAEPRAATPPIPRTIPCVGALLGALTGVALLAFEPASIAQLHALQGFVGLALALTVGLSVLFARQDGLRTAAIFVLCFEIGVLLLALGVSAMSVAQLDESALLDPIAWRWLDPTTLVG